MKYIRNLHNIDDKVISVLPQAGKYNRVFIRIVVICGVHKYCIPLFLRGIGTISDIIRSYVLWNWNGVRQIIENPKLPAMLGRTE